MSTRIFLLRHGTTAANLDNRFAGRTEEPLHQEGKNQLSVVAATLDQYRVHHIYCGPLNRTRMSAEIIATATGMPHETHDAFNEINISHWDGLTKDKIREQFGPEYPAWLETPDKFSVPGCETLAQVQERAVKGIEQIFAAHHDHNIVVVSHLIVVRCLVLHYKNMPISDFRSIKISNGSITELIRNDSGPVSVLLGEDERNTD